ncbi:MAG: hypothetical protein EOO73_26425 [Myxococcales bacterium]|nr:MAG: hypothetical protein EOO73_26425 [Myxococcales bacterium]
MNVAVTRNAADYVGTLRLEGPQGASNERTVHATTCSDVIDGLAVAAALALPASPQPVTGSPRAAEVAGISRPEAVTARTQTLPATDDLDRPDELRLAPAFTLTGFGGLSVGLLRSTPLPRYELSLTWASLARRGGNGRIVGPLIRLGLNLYGSGSYETPGMTTKLGAQALTVGPCYAPVYSDRGLVLLACLDLTAGLVGASTVDRDTNASHSESLGFGSIGAGLQAVYNVGRHFHIALRAGTEVQVAPLVFRDANGSELFRSSRFGGHASLGAGGHF